MLLQERPLKTQPKAVNCTSEASPFCSTFETIQPAFCGDMLTNFHALRYVNPEVPIWTMSTMELFKGRTPKSCLNFFRWIAPLHKCHFSHGAFSSVSNRSRSSLPLAAPRCYFRLLSLLESGAAGNALVGGGAGGCIAVGVKIGLVGARRKELPAWIGPSAVSGEILALWFS